MNQVDEQYIKILLNGELEKKVDITKNTYLRDLDIDSLAFVSIGSEIEDVYNIKLIQNMKQIEEMKQNLNTFQDFIDFLNSKINEQRKS